MSDQPRDLDVVQEWMQAVITHPNGIVAGIESDSARRRIDVTANEVEEVIGRSHTLTSIDRLAIYGNAYYARLLECLREEFPALAQAVGEESFNAFAFGYLQTYPSRSYTLAQLGANFPRYLTETRPDDDTQSATANWTDLVIDLATLERTYSEVFDGFGPERQQLLQPDDLQAISADRWPAARLVPVDCLRLLELKFPVHEYATAVRQNQQPPPPDSSPTFLVVTRRDYVVRRSTVSELEFRLLSAILGGAAVGDAINQTAEAIQSQATAAAAASDPSNVEAALETALDAFSRNLQDWFRKWTSAGYFRTVEC